MFIKKQNFSPDGTDTAGASNEAEGQESTENESTETAESEDLDDYEMISDENLDEFAVKGENNDPEDEEEAAEEDATEEPEEETELTAEEIVAKAAADGTTVTEEEAATWIKVGEQLGIKIENDDFDEFLVKVKEKIESPKIALDKYSEEQRRIIEAFDAGVSIEELGDPNIEFKRLLALNDVALVTAQLKEKGYDKAGIDKRLQLFKDRAEIDIIAEDIRLSLNNAMKQNIAINAQEKKAAKEAERAKIISDAKAENDAIFAEIDAYKDFEGRPISKKEKDEIKQNWLKDDGYRRRFQKDAKFVVDSIMAVEYGKKAVKTAKSVAERTASEAERDKIKRKLFNIEDLPKNRGGNSTTTEKVGTNEFEGWNVVNRKR